MRNQERDMILMSPNFDNFLCISGIYSFTSSSKTPGEQKNEQNVTIYQIGVTHIGTYNLKLTTNSKYDFF